MFGAMPPKGQEMDDHYFGVIRRADRFLYERVSMKSSGSWALPQRPSTTRSLRHSMSWHRSMQSANVAVDHNQIVMETLKKVACRHGLQCLLHEKPFAGVNGSGKHNNWSLTTDDGINLLDPGNTPHENIQFLLVLACILKAVDMHADLLRESAADVGNDHRLGANEAPPAIISVSS